MSCSFHFRIAVIVLVGMILAGSASGAISGAIRAPRPHATHRQSRRPENFERLHLDGDRALHPSAATTFKNIPSTKIPCPCANHTLCEPIIGSPKFGGKEVFAFVPSDTNWQTYDWDKITTLATYNTPVDSHMFCHARAHRVRIAYAASFPADQLTNGTARRIWASSVVDTVAGNLLDGINIDFESPIAEGSPEKDGLTLLMVELGERLRPTVKGGGQLTFDVAWRPGGIDGRFYDYAALADVTDFLIIMDYDTRSQVFNVTTCTAAANAPASTMITGVEEYLNLYNDSSKFVLGVPWYGYEYGCVNSYAGAGTVCQIERTNPPWRGCNCSDAAGVEINYDIIMKIVANETHGVTLLGGVDVNTTAAGAGLYAKQDLIFKKPSVPAPGGWSQFWFDTPQTLQQKYRYAALNHLRGISMWNAGLLSNATSGAGAKQRKEMWGVMDSFLHPSHP